MLDSATQALARQPAPFRPAAASHVRAASTCSQGRLGIHRSHAPEASSSGRSGQICCIADGAGRQQPLGDCSLGRRAALAGAALSMLALSKRPARAFISPPAGSCGPTPAECVPLQTACPQQLLCATGFRVHQDKLDGYVFFVPENWLPVTVREEVSWVMHVPGACDQITASHAPLSNMRRAPATTSSTATLTMSTRTCLWTCHRHPHPIIHQWRTWGRQRLPPSARWTRSARGSTHSQLHLVPCN